MTGRIVMLAVSAVTTLSAVAAISLSRLIISLVLTGLTRSLVLTRTHVLFALVARLLSAGLLIATALPVLVLVCHSKWFN
jgi:hypothetical protein